MGEGWVKIHRKIQECELWLSPEPFDVRSAWIDLVLLANHKDKQTVFDGSQMTILKGQRLTSIRLLAERWHWSRKKVSNFLNRLERHNMIEQNRDRKRTIITIVNYGIYQTMGATEEPLKSHTRATEEPLKSLNKNEKNEKNDKEYIRHRHGEYQNVLLSDEDLEKLKAEIPEGTLTKLIEELSSYMASTGKTYKSHLATLRNWARRRKEDTNKKPVEKFGEFQSKGTDLDELQRRLTVN